MVHKLSFILLFISVAAPAHFHSDIRILNDQKKNNTSVSNDDDYILCRRCGCDISSSTSKEAFNDSLFSKDEVLVQILISDVIFNFPIVTTAQSSCISVGEWQDQDSWFPGYRWKPCVCPDCGSFVGFVFEPVNSSDSSKRIFGLILTNIIGENCKYYMFLYLQDGLLFM